MSVELQITLKSEPRGWPGDEKSLYCDREEADGTHKPCSQEWAKVNAGRKKKATVSHIITEAREGTLSMQ